MSQVETTDAISDANSSDSFSPRIDKGKVFKACHAPYYLIAPGLAAVSKGWRERIHNSKGSFSYEQLSIMTVLLVFALALQIVGYFYYKRSLRMKLDVSGITVTKWGRNKFVRWQDVTSIMPGLSSAIIHSQDGSIRLRWILYRDEDWGALADMIERLTPKHVDSSAVVRWIREGMNAKANSSAKK